MIAAVLGSATNGLAELETLRSLATVSAVYAVNDAAACYSGPLDAFVTLHPEKLPEWVALRSYVDSSHKCEYIAHCEGPLVTRVVDYRWPGMNASGSSGLFAVKVALEKPENKVVLCGVPMDAMRAHFNNTLPWFEVDSFWSAWTIALPYIKDRVRSMSGRTAQLLGMPTREFLTQTAGR